MRLPLVSRWVLQKLTAREGYKPINGSAAAEVHGASLGESLGGEPGNHTTRSAALLTARAPACLRLPPRNQSVRATKCRLGDHAVTPLPAR